MATTITKFKNHQIRNIAGFSLIELMVALAVVGIVAACLNNLMASQDRVYRLQDRSAEMDQNLRAAMDMITRDYLNCGRGPDWSTISGSDASAWYNAANGWSPYNIATANTIHMIGCFGGTARGTLAAQANAGATTVTLQAGEADSFPVGSSINIGGSRTLSGEDATVTNLAGNVLAITTNPAVVGVALQKTNVVNTEVCRLQWATYSVNTGDNTLTVNYHDGNGATVVADRISGMAFGSDGADPTLITITMNGVTNGSTAVATSITNRVYRRNN